MQLKNSQLGFLFALSLFLHLGIFTAFLIQGGEMKLLVVDASQYLEIGKNIFSGHGFSMSYAAPYLPDGVRTPLYPLWLGFWYALTGHFWPAVLAQVVLNSFLPILTILIGSYFIHDKRILLAAGIFTAIEPNLLYYTSVVATEGVFIFLFTLGLYLFLRAALERRETNIAASAFTFGLATLVRPVAQFISLAAALFLYESNRQGTMWGKIILYLLVFLLVLSPWIVRNEVAFKTPMLSSFIWLNLFTRTSPSVIALRDHITYQDAYEGLLKGLQRDGFIANTYEEKELIKMNSPFMAPELRRRALDVIFSSPMSLVKVYLLSFVNFFTQDNSYVLFHELGFLPSVPGAVSPSLLLFQEGVSSAVRAMWHLLENPSYLVLYFGRIMWLGITCLMLWGARTVLASDSKTKHMATFLLVVIFYFALSSLPTTAELDARLRAPVIPIEIMFASYGAVSFWGRMRNKLIGPSNVLI